MNKEQLKDKILAMPYPSKEAEKYFEWHSADGFAFLGAAKALLGLDFQFELEAIKERNYSLSHANYIDQVAMTDENQYVYTMWTCGEFLYSAWRMAQRARCRAGSCGR